MQCKIKKANTEFSCVTPYKKNGGSQEVYSYYGLQFLNKLGHYFSLISLKNWSRVK